MQNRVNFKTLLILFTVINLFCAPVFALNFDISADDEIRKKYNPNKLEEDVGLPALPKIDNEEIISQPQTAKSATSTSKQSSNPTKPIANQVKLESSVKQVEKKVQPQAKIQPPKEEIPHIATGHYATLHKGTKIRVKLLNTISDKTKKGAKIAFASQYPVSTTFFTIPMGTIFKGEVIDSHRPQVGGNGGLLVLDINSMSINGGNQQINAIVTEVNGKKVFLNNIKGQRGYFKSMKKSMRPGCHFFGKMMKVTGTLANDGSSIILTPFAIAAGLVAAGGNIVASPVLAFFHKGNQLFVRDGSWFEIKLKQDVVIYN